MNSRPTRASRRSVESATLAMGPSLSFSGSSPPCGGDATGMGDWRMATMAALDERALALPQATKELSDGGRPAYYEHGKLFCFHRRPRRDSIDSDNWERFESGLKV